MDRTERLLDLVTLLLDARRPVPWRRLREYFPEDYGAGAEEACERKFERDKAELLDLGIPLRFVPAADEDESGYLVDRDAYYLPEPGLSAEELAVLYAAGSAALASGAFPGREELAHALRKLRYFTPARPPELPLHLEPGVSVDRQHLPQRLDALWSAIRARKRVTLVYRSPRSDERTTRQVDPYGLALRRGAWALAGFCHLRGALRTFFVHRIQELEVNGARPRTPDFEVPPGFRLADVVPRWPWQYRFHAPIDVEVSLSEALAPLSPQLLGVDAEPAGTGARAMVRATDLDALVRTVLSMTPDAKVVGPEAAVVRARAMASAVLEAHQEARP